MSRLGRSANGSGRILTAGRCASITPIIRMTPLQRQIRGVRPAFHRWIRAGILSAIVGLPLAPAQTILDATWIAGTGNTNIATNWLGVTVVPSNGNGGFNYNWIVDGNTT